MKYLVAVCRIFVGVLFIISGLIKLNDPLGFSYKLQEYFSPEVLNLPALVPYALMFSVLIVTFEVILGVFLLIGYKPKFTSWSLLGLIIFFTFLTFYSAYFDKVRDCGCFGDAMKLTPWQSFSKDMFLLVLIVFIFIGKRHITPVFRPLPTTILALLSFVFCFWFGYHVLVHLPVVDFRAYKIGTDIKKDMSMPEDAAKPVIEYTWKFEVNGEEKDITNYGEYPDVDGKLIGADTEVIDEGYQPPIYDFSIEDGENDLTDHFLSQDSLIVVISYSLENIESEGAFMLKGLQDRARKNGYTIIGLTSSSEAKKQQFNMKYDLDFKWYLCDEKALKTVVRANPGILELRKGVIKQKWNWHDVDKLKL